MTRFKDITGNVIITDLWAARKKELRAKGGRFCQSKANFSETDLTKD